MRLDATRIAANEISYQDVCRSHAHAGQKQAICDHQDQTDLETINNSKILDFRQIDTKFDLDRNSGEPEKIEKSAIPRGGGTRTISRINGCSK